MLTLRQKCYKMIKSYWEGELILQLEMQIEFFYLFIYLFLQNQLAPICKYSSEYFMFIIFWS